MEGVAHINLSPNMFHEITKEEVNCHVLGVIVAQQFSLKAGLKKFGNEGNVEVTKELKQLHDVVTYIPWTPPK